jgi:hypothetical protein
VPTGRFLFDRLKLPFLSAMEIGYRRRYLLIADIPSGEYRSPST